MEETTVFGQTPTTFMFFPLIGVLVIVSFFAIYARGRYREGKEISVGSLGWAIFFALALVFLSVWCGRGLIGSYNTYWLQSIVLLTAGGSIVTLRERTFHVLEDLEGRSRGWRALVQVIRCVRDLALVYIACDLAHLALELPSNPGTYGLSSNSVAIEFGVIFCTTLVAYFLFQRRSVGPAIALFACLFTGLAEHFVIEFKQSAILPMELLALGTAADVAGQYTYILDSNSMRGLIYCVIAMIGLSFIRPGRMATRRALAVNVSVNLVLAVASSLALSWWFTTPAYHDDYGYKVNYWDSPKSYRRDGILPSFLTALEDMPMVEPEGYDADEAQELVSSYAKRADDMTQRAKRREVAEKQYAEEQPSVVIVMNETFADLSRLDGLTVDYEGPTFFKSIDDCLRRGQIAVSVYGAGTCNTEFEVLTANSLAFVGANKYPYQMFELDETANLARQFKELGYGTSAMHPMPGNNWNRNKVYAALGFDNFYNSDNDFEGAPIFHNGPTDRATYERIIEILKSETDAPQFVFDVTMQNHGSYVVGNIPPERLTTFQPTGFSTDDNAQLNEYLSCIQASDEDLEWLVGELRALDRPVVLVFFGDHHPKISNTYNDAIFDVNVEGAAEHQERIYQTEYIVWANYDVEGNSQTSEIETVGTDYLGALTLDLIGAPLEDFQKAQIGVHQRLQAINAVGYLGTDGAWYIPDTMPYLDVTYRDMEKMDYLRFGSTVS